uniref:nucleotidyl transferase AbiEii/AbiGii toxin family protein n=1 Tax=Azospirillum argentinense TaxID=2970906 RepID=UPI00158647FE|nr:nucleotidyl transferase AbiEii/AbiGii toxin family protein [Azospirillum argentinense]
MTLRIDSLPPETKRLLDTISTYDEISDFVLIGGTALALSWGHRRSEDLDFAIPRMRLPRPICDRILERLETDGWEIEDVGNEMARLYAENDGEDLADTQQDFLCRFGGGIGVKLTFFAEYHPKRHPPYTRDHLHYRQVRIMPPEGIFELKSQVIMRRKTSRDLYDIWAFLERGRSVDEILEEARKEARHCSYETLRSRLLPKNLPLYDPGLKALVDDGPKDFAAVKAALLVHLDRYEQRIAATMLAEDNGGSDNTP